MILKYGLQACYDEIHFWIDNAEVLRRIQTSACDDFRLKSFYARDYSHTTLMRNLKDAIPSTIEVIFKKIKSHQITSSDSATTNEVHLNHLADS